MSKTYSIKQYHLEKLQALKRDIQSRQTLREKREAAETAAARDEWLTWKANCKPLKGKQMKLI